MYVCPVGDWDVVGLARERVNDRSCVILIRGIESAAEYQSCTQPTPDHSFLLYRSVTFPLFTSTQPPSIRLSS